MIAKVSGFKKKSIKNNNLSSSNSLEFGMLTPRNSVVSVSVSESVNVILFLNQDCPWPVERRQDLKSQIHRS